MTRKTTSYSRKKPAPKTNAVKLAVAKQQIAADIARLRDDSGLQAFTGSNAGKICNTVGRLVYITSFAIGKAGLSETPEARIIAGTASALGDLAESHNQLETHRGAIISGLEAIERIITRLDVVDLACGSIELDGMLASTHGMGTSDVHRAMGAA